MFSPTFGPLTILAEFTSVLNEPRSSKSRCSEHGEVHVSASRSEAANTLPRRLYQPQHIMQRKPFRLFTPTRVFHCRGTFASFPA